MAGPWLSEWLSDAPFPSVKLAGSRFGITKWVWLGMSHPVMSVYKLASLNMDQNSGLKTPFGMVTFQGRCLFR